MLKWLGLILAIIYLSAPIAYAAENNSPLGAHYKLEHDKRERSYYLFAPKGDAKTALPLVLVLHGGGGSPQNIANVTGFSELAAKEKFLVGYPAGTGRISTWNAGKCCGYAERLNVDDVGFIEKLIADVKTRRNVDASRIYVTGISNGGMMAYRLACEMGEVFAAFAPVAAAMNVH
ncbi:MAG: alpha/beta hydrolase-fold protein, partial [Alphaproteobacteria bacterium]|nr:alpha/beta hydrolase-fold protein [Alphaproteobacteria bacterium]